VPGRCPARLNIFNMNHPILILISFAVLFVTGHAQIILPQLPNTDAVELCFPDTTGYVRVTVGPFGRTYDNLQDALNQVELGSVIVLDAGETFRGSFSLPNKTSGTGWVVIIGSAQDRLVRQGERCNPTALVDDGKGLTQAQLMPKIVTTHLSGLPCFQTRARAHHYWLAGLEITVAESVPSSYGLVNFGDASSSQNSLDLVPHHLVVDRCFVHGNTTANIMKYGVRLDCSNAAIIDSHISDFHSVGFDAQAVSGINGPGPFKIINNYLEASGENIMFGGAAAAIPGLVPSDIEIRQNHLFKPLSWNVKHANYAGKHWTIKNLFELKTGRRVLVDGNIMENCWADLPIGQSGYAILLTVRTEGGGSPQADVSDVTISNNIIRHVAAGISISGSDDGKGNRSSRINFYNNLFDDVDGQAYGDGNVAGPNIGTFLKIGEPSNVTFNHNTVFQNGSVTWAYGTSNGFTFTNNLVNAYTSAGGYQGMYGPGKAQGNATISSFFPDLTDASKRFHKNILIGTDANKYSSYSSASKNYFPTSIQEVGFENFALGISDYHGYALQTQSPFKKSASDGRDIGVDFVELDSALFRKRDCGVTTNVQPRATTGTDVLLYPMPAQSVLNVVSSSNFYSATVYNLMGEEIHKMLLESYSVSPPLNSYTICVAPMQVGTYVLVLFSSENAQRYMFRIER
jgi:hypothetical protein